MRHSSFRWTSKPPVSVRPDWQHPMSDGLVACYNFNEGGGVTIFDAARYGTGTLSGAPIVWSPGPFGMCPRFQSGQDISIANNPNLPLGSFSVQVRFLSDSLPSPKTIVSKYNVVAAPFRVTCNTVPSVSFIVGNGATEASLSANISLNTWYDLVGVYDGTNVKLYLNGVLSASGTPALTPADTGTFHIGSLAGAAQFFSGYIDCVRLWNRALAPGEITRLWTSPYTIMQAPLQKIVSFWPPDPIAQFKHLMTADLYQLKGKTAKLVALGGKDANIVSLGGKKATYIVQ